MKKWLPFIGWRDATPEEAYELALEQPARWQWRVFEIEWLGHGFTIMAKPGATS